jgi:ABC-type spermidine/putrescine transport system permease subunit I
MGLGLVDQPIAFLAERLWVWPAILTIITWNTLPLVTLTFMASLQSLPDELIEAARSTAPAAGSRSASSTCRISSRRSSSWC